MGRLSVFARPAPEGRILTRVSGFSRHEKQGARRRLGEVSSSESTTLDSTRASQRGADGPVASAVPGVLRTPIGTVTLLFTDIEASTRAWERDPERMKHALAAHDEIVREAIEATGGVVFKTMGDSFCAVFPTAQGALHAALAAQLVLHESERGDAPLPRVRMAIHSGAVEERDGDYFGPSLNHVARLLEIAHGGQTLVSRAAYHLLPDRLPSEMTLVDLGEHRLRDLQRPTRVHQMRHPDLPSKFPPLRSLDALPHNLPTQLTSFIGREREIAELKEIVCAHRLVTLTGPGGGGKTRLALQMAAEAIDRFRDGVWFVGLASLVDPTLVAQTVAKALGLRPSPEQSSIELLREYGRSRELLLVLDNCEHLIEACANLAEDLLRSCLELRILATSRETLNVPGETVWNVPPLALPERDGTTARDGLRYEGVRLFVSRAGHVQPHFELTDENADAVARICRHLDGVPLAIELAAARARFLSVEQIEERLVDRFGLLEGGGRTVMERHQTLRSAIDWSHELLSEAERTLFRRLAVFAGGWTVESVERIVAGPGFGTAPSLEPQEVLSVLCRLVEKSLVQVEEERGNVRHRLLETLREYAWERLSEAGEERESRERHRDYFLSLAELADPQLVRVDKAIWLERLEAEHDNFRAALEWTLTRDGEVDLGLRLAVALHRFWLWHGYLADGIEWLERALARGTDASPEPKAAALAALGLLARLRGERERFRAAGEESLRIAREAGDRIGTARALTLCALAAQDDENLDEASRLNEEALALGREVGEPSIVAVALNSLGETARLEGDFERARKRYRQVLAETGDVANDEVAYFNLGQVAVELDEIETARECYRRSMQLGISTNNRWILSYGLLGFGQTLVDAEPRRAAQLMGAGEALREIVGSVLYAADPWLLNRSIRAARGALGEADFEQAWSEGQRMSLEEALEEAVPGGFFRSFDR